MEACYHQGGAVIPSITFFILPDNGNPKERIGIVGSIHMFYLDRNRQFIWGCYNFDDYDENLRSDILISPYPQPQLTHARTFHSRLPDAGGRASPSALYRSRGSRASPRGLKRMPEPLCKAEGAKLSPSPARPGQHCPTPPREAEQAPRNPFSQLSPQSSGACRRSKPASSGAALRPGAAQGRRI